LDQVLRSTRAQTVICLGDSFDDMTASATLPEEEVVQLNTLQAGRQWIWIEGNHDPGPVGIGGTHLAEVKLEAITFRHIPQPQARGEISGHYHPKAQVAAKGRASSRPAFLIDQSRVIMPAFGTYTGGLRSTDTAFDGLLGPGALAVLTGTRPIAIPMPR
jgi:DNA ligase-associated metallophosphoesterase